MFGNGLEREVIIAVLPKIEERAPSMFGGGGIYEYQYDRLGVWADRGYKTLFEKIPGVFKVENDDTGRRYVVSVDPRYNLKWVMAEIEAVAKTKKPRQQRKKKADRGSLGYLTFSIVGTDTSNPADDTDSDDDAE
jgi:hypothetical protein